MPTNFLWGARQAAISLLTTELNSLASGSGTAFGPEYDNTATGKFWQKGDLELFIASSSSAFVAGSYVNVYFVTSPDGTNYPKYTSGASWKLAENNYHAATISLHPATLAGETLYETVRGILIPSAKFKAVLVNQSGVALPASGNTLKLYPTPEQY